MKRSWFRRWPLPRFTLGTLLILILLCAIPLGYVASLRSQNAARCAAWERLARKGVQFHLDPSIAPNVKVIAIERGWWMTLTKETPTFRSIEVLEPYSAAGQPPKVYISDEDLRLFAHFPEVESVSLTGTEHITDQGLGTLASLPKLRSFHANCLSRIDGEFLQAWSKSNSLEHLTLWNMAKLKGENLAALENFTRLRALTLMSCVYLDKTPLNAVNMPPQLVDLRIQYTPITDDALSRWLSQTMLRTLVLDTAFSRKIAPQLRQQTQLSVLSITNSPLTDDDLMFLGRCPALYNVAIVGAPVEGAFLRRIPTRNQVDFLTLRGVPLKEEHAAELKRLKKLAHLDLGWTPIRGEFLAGAHWPALVSTDLCGTQLSEAGKANLAAISWQTSSTVWYPANFSADNLASCAASQGVLTAILSDRYAGATKASGVSASRYESPASQMPTIDRCGEVNMKAVRHLIERAKEDAATLRGKGDENRAR